MSIHSMFKTDPQAEAQGIEIDYGEGCIITVARMGGANTKYKKALEIAMKPYRRAIQTNTMSNDKAEEIMLECFIRNVLVTWEGVTDPETKEVIEFSIDNARTLMLELPDLYQDLVAQAKDISLFREQLIEDDAKN